jgi:hypothetical protein
MPVVIWRDSVAIGDDVDAPDEWAMPVAGDASIGAVVGAQRLVEPETPVATRALPTPS